MTDIVERLRDWIPEKEIEGKWVIDFDAIDDQREKAADEIERLRRALLQIRSYIDCPEHYNKHIDNIIDAAVGPEMPLEKKP